MRALIARPDSTGPVLADVAEPTLGPGQVAIRTAAATVNPIDVMIASGAVRDVFGLQGDVGLGWDFAGVIEKVGDGVDSVRVGQRVAALTANVQEASRAHAEVVVVPASSVAAVPASLDDVEAATVPLNALAASQILDLLGPSEGGSLLVTGAAGAVGGYLLVLAADRGWKVTGLGREGDQAFVTGAGATFVSELNPSAYDAVADAATLQEQAIPAVRDGGRFVGVLSAAPVPSQRGIKVSALAVQPDGATLGQLLQRTASGELAARVDEAVPFDNFSAAYAKLGQQGRRGRVVLTF